MLSHSSRFYITRLYYTHPAAQPGNLHLPTIPMPSAVQHYTFSILLLPVSINHSLLLPVSLNHSLLLFGHFFNLTGRNVLLAVYGSWWSHIEWLIYTNHNFLVEVERCGFILSSDNPSTSFFRRYSRYGGLPRWSHRKPKISKIYSSSTLLAGKE